MARGRAVMRGKCFDSCEHSDPGKRMRLELRLGHGVLLLAVFLNCIPGLNCSGGFSGLGRIGSGTRGRKIPDSVLEQGILEQIAQDEMEEDRFASNDEADVSSDLGEASDDGSWPRTKHVNSVNPGPPIEQTADPIVGLRRRFKEENMLNNLRSQRSGAGIQEEDAQEAAVEPPQEVISKLERENAVLRRQLEVLSGNSVRKEENVFAPGRNGAEMPFVAPSEHAMQMLNTEQAARLGSYLHPNMEDGGGEKRPKHGIKRSRGWNNEGKLSDGADGDSELQSQLETSRCSQSPLDIQGEGFKGGSFWQNLRTTVQGEAKQEVRAGEDVFLVPGVTEGVGCRLSEMLGYEGCMLWEEGVAARMGIADASLLAVGDQLRACSVAGGAGGLGRILVESSSAFGSLKAIVEGVRQLDALGVGAVVIGDLEESGWSQSGKELMEAEQYLRALSAAVTARDGQQGGLVLLARSMASSAWGAKEGMVEEVVRRMQAAMECGVDGVVIDLWGEGKGMDLEAFKAVCASLSPQPRLLVACVHAGFQDAQGGLLQALAQCGCSVLLVPELTSMRVVEAESQALRTLKGLKSGDENAGRILGKSLSSELWVQCTGAARLAALVGEL
eukprot:960349-Rhodomonas_salina.3